MIRVLHSVSNMDRAGIETMLMNYYRHIDKNIIQFDFLCNKLKPGAYDEEIKTMGGNIFHSPGLNPLNFFKYDKFMKKLFQENPDIKIVHSHNGELAYQSLRGAYKNNIETRICHAHNTKIEPNFKKPLKLLYKTQLKKVANNYWGCGIDAVRFYFGNKIVDNNNYSILHNAIEIERFVYNKNKREELREVMGLRDRYVIGHVGRFSEQKNHEFILNLFKIILQREKKAILMLIGNGELLDKMKIKANKLGIYESVLFMGNIENVNEMYQVMDVFLLPSLFEGLPVVGIEAQASGLKCFMSDVITKEVKITDNVKYLSLKNDIKEKWANEVLNCKEYERKNMTNEIINAGYSIKTETEKLERIYLNFVKEKE